MYDYSGILYRIICVAGIILLLGLACILARKPWMSGFKLHECKVGLVCIAVSLCLICFYSSSMIFPSISTYTGQFIDTHRNSRVAPPLPLTDEFVFFNGCGKKKVVYLDVFSQKHVLPADFEEGQIYTVYYDKRTNVILKITKTD